MKQIAISSIAKEVAALNAALERQGVNKRVAIVEDVVKYSAGISHTGLTSELRIVDELARFGHTPTSPEEISHILNLEAHR